VLAVAVVAAGVLITTVAGARGKTGGTLNVDLTTDIDFADPALAYDVLS
jgi:hypothetical protein